MILDSAHHSTSLGMFCSFIMFQLAIPASVLLSVDFMVAACCNIFETCNITNGLVPFDTICNQEFLSISSIKLCTILAVLAASSWAFAKCPKYRFTILMTSTLSVLLFTCIVSAKVLTSLSGEISHSSINLSTFHLFSSIRKISLLFPVFVTCNVCLQAMH